MRLARSPEKINAGYVVRGNEENLNGKNRRQLSRCL